MAADTDRAGHVTPADLRRRLADGDPMTLLDVRDRTEIERWRIEAPNYHHVPYMKFVAAGVTGDVADLLPDDLHEPVVVVCPRGEASAEVADQLVAAGVDAENLAGGMEAWARLYDRVAVWADDTTTVYQYQRPASGCLGYAVVSDGEMAVVDPLRAFTDRYRDDADELDATLTHAVDTHVHADHVSGVRALAASGATPVLPARAVERGVVDGTDFETIADGDELAVGTATLRAVALPGHTTGMTALVVDGVLLSGDSLFVESVARPDLEREDAGAADLAHELYVTLTEQFGLLPDDVLVAPGHYSEAAEQATDGTYSATLGELRGELWTFETTEAAFVERYDRLQEGV